MMNNRFSLCHILGLASEEIGCHDTKFTQEQENTEHFLFCNYFFVFLVVIVNMDIRRYIVAPPGGTILLRRLYKIQDSLLLA